MAGITGSTDRFNGVVASLAIKVRCVVVATANVASLIGAQIIEGVSVTTGDRILLTAQNDPIENGVYDVCDPTAWQRAADWDGNRDVELGSTVWAGRSAGSDALYQVTAPAGVIQPGNTAVTISLLFDPALAVGGGLDVVTGVGNDTLGNNIIISGTDPALTLKDSNNSIATATGRMVFTDQADVEVARVSILSSDLVLSSAAGDIVASPSGSFLITTNMTMTEQSSALNPGAGFGRWWVRDDVPSTPIFTDDTGQEFELNKSIADGSSEGQVLMWDDSAGLWEPPANDTIRFSEVTPPPTLEGRITLALSSTADKRRGGVMFFSPTQQIGNIWTTYSTTLFHGFYCFLDDNASPAVLKWGRHLFSDTTGTDLFHMRADYKLVADKGWYFIERVAADTDIATLGQLWVRDDAPNTLMFTDDVGTDFIVGGAISAAYTRDATIVEDRTLLASASATTINNNNVLAALIADLQTRGILG